MAPPKTMLLSQQQPQQPTLQIGQQVDHHNQQQQQQAARQGKPRKRKSNKQVITDQQILTSQNEQKQQLDNNSINKLAIESTALINGSPNEGLIGSTKVTSLKTTTAMKPAVVASERITVKQKQQQQQQQQVPTQVKTENNIIISESPKRAEADISVVTSASLVTAGKKQKQLSTDEADDIDAGIELDGSSNSGSSVKDINDDQLKSTSVSPVMAPQVVSGIEGSEAVNDDDDDDATCTMKQPLKQNSIELVERGEEQLASEVSAVVSKLCSAPSPAKKISSMTKQQLAANQQVIDADERLLQEKLQNKQRRKSQQENNTDNQKQQQTASLNTNNVKTTQAESNSNRNSSKSTTVVVAAAAAAEVSSTSTGTQPGALTTTNNTPSSSSSQATPYRRKFSSSSSRSISQEGQDSSLCKICDQHVYQMERMMAEKSIYHKRCFRCHQCKIQLRVDNYSSHEGQVYCKAHHRQLFQPQVKLDSEDDVDIVAQSTLQPVDDYLLHRGRLSELSFSFLQPKPEEIRKRQMIICENNPAELPKDVVRSDTKLDDGIQQLNLNLNNILEKFERGTAGNAEENQSSSSSSTGIIIEKPSFNIKKTLMAFESRLVNNSIDEDSTDSSKMNERTVEQPVVKRLTNINGFLNRQNSIDKNDTTPSGKPLAVRRSESLLMRLKKYESRIAGEQVDDDDENSDENDDENNNKNMSNNNNEDSTSEIEKDDLCSNRRTHKDKKSYVKPKKLTSIDLSSLKSQWESGDISRRRVIDDEDDDAAAAAASFGKVNEIISTSKSAAGDNNNLECNGRSPLTEKNDELSRIREQLAQKKIGEAGGSIRNIYENAIREAQLQQKQQQASNRRELSDLSTLNGFSTSGIQQQLLQKGSGNSESTKTPTTLNKDHFHLNLSNKANKLKEKFELGLITNSSHDDSDQSDNGEAPVLTKLEQIRQEKLEDLSVFTEGEIKAREARSLFQQIDRRLSAAGNSRDQQQQPVVNSRSLASIGASMRAKLTNQMNSHNNDQVVENKQQPIRLTNNVRM